ncbi:MAG TPA: peptidyl-prolyl cis-trans isomerase [Bacillus sp. (in: firmicutes)]|uniref:peptidyl-prolyl cis-trans isomerase n=1 Tax=Bacillus litorisediminis TaxID=2922713 RepID=UPI001FAE321C|nr:peptidyl-prolyl cis-trans isomerase [Bacillus litorisediminis]HWO74841.1 peptidyl-prolyl cis-trans isomerase [Bacillus sp. (in: firmicutes)]
MDFIIQLKGNVRFPLTLDPTVWIFDDRKLDLDETTQETKEEKDFTEVLSKNWEKEIMEGAVSPPTIKSEKKFLKEKILNGTFAMPFKPFLENAEPNKDASQLIVETKDGEIALPLAEANNILLKFSHQGKPLKEDGPVHVIYGDRSNFENPIKNVKAFIVK